jgi:ABC-type polysaccharide/polyol phosphate transport system ATPase subunit
MRDLIELNSVDLTYRVLVNRSSSLKELIRDALKGRIRIREFKALQQISFRVTSGEVLAVLGKNGAGKSTLLKVLARVLPPTSGTVSILGNIAPMIELGAGFHPEMTGTENVRFYSALLGRDLKVVENRISAIGEWAGVTDHMDLPLRTFSSGMVARLAFAVATDQGADILLIDEVLSVGDVEFQSKSAERMKQLISGGAAVVLVSHDLTAVRRLATKAIWIESGRVMKYGDVEAVTSEYERSFEN